MDWLEVIRSLTLLEIIIITILPAAISISIGGIRSMFCSCCGLDGTFGFYYLTKITLP
jgi:hypothetical protein